MGALLLIVILVGYVAAVFSTVSLIPQLHKVWKTKRAEEISFYWLGFLSTSQVLWLIYGVYINSVPVAATAIITLLIALVLTVIVMIDDKVSFKFGL